MTHNRDLMPWWRELHARFADCLTPAELFAELEQQVRRQGFDCFAHGQRGSVPFSQVRTTFSGTYPQAWLERQVHGEGATQASLQLARGRGFAVWQRTDGDPGAVLGDARDCGLAWGASVAGWGRDRGLRVLCVARYSGKLAAREVLPLKWMLRALAELFDEHLAAFQPRESAELGLSERETEILRWLADGECSKGIAQVLGLSENTVNWHIKRILRKFKSPNRVLAAARAAALGVI